MKKIIPNKIKNLHQFCGTFFNSYKSILMQLKNIIIINRYTKYDFNNSPGNGQTKPKAIAPNIINGTFFVIDIFKKQ